MITYDPKNLEEEARNLFKAFRNDYKGQTKSVMNTDRKWWRVEKLKIHATKDSLIQWKTKRHKGSCRALCFDPSGSNIFTAGSDNVLKCANSVTGKVLYKVVLDIKSRISKMIVAPTKPLILIGDESGNVHVYDQRTLKKLHFIENCHGDAVNGIVSLASTNENEFVSCGSSSLTHFNVKSGIIAESEDQEDEIMSVTVVDPDNCEVLMCGMSEGGVSVWNKNSNNFDSMIRKTKTGEDSVDSVIGTLKGDSCVWAGTSGGLVHLIHSKNGKILETREHSKTDDVTFLDLDYEYRLITCGTDRVRLWGELQDVEKEEDEEEQEEEEETTEEEEDPSDSSDSTNDIETDLPKDISSEYDENKSSINSNDDSRVVSDRSALLGDIDNPSESIQKKKRRKAIKNSGNFVLDSFFAGL
ncbi:hypothetical protein LJB42_001231 [Komagataella kurtzmanii]|nr:hypothetical protein LJB42_001231 [Komagataella kurtzmanii]